MQDQKTLEFIEKAKKIHGDKYNYSLVKYINNITKVIIICPEHGDFEQNPSGHLSGNGCVKCSLISRINKRKSNSSDFINKAKAIHGDKYDYSLTEYINSKTKIKIICPEHGEFKQDATGHLSGNGCSKCGRLKTSSARIYQTEDFINKSKVIHGDKYDYSIVDYKAAKLKVKIICPEHGIFEQNPTNHLGGQGCNNCNGKKQLTTKEFIDRAIEKHGNKFDYSLVNYVNANTKIIIICQTHGHSNQVPSAHLSGPGCPKCSVKYKLTNDEFKKAATLVYGNKHDYSLVEFKSVSKPVCIIDEYGFKHYVRPNLYLDGTSLSIKSAIDKTDYFKYKASLIHSHKYDYSLIEYVDSKTKIKIICKEHGVFEQAPSNHIQGNCCPKCVGGVIVLNTISFIEKAKAIYGDEYDYSLVDFKNSKSSIVLIDNNGVGYEIISSSFLNGVKPNSSHVIDKNKYFIDVARKIHGDKYDYSLVKHVDSKTKIKIICKEHGVFEQQPTKHLSGQGCSICNNGFSNKYKIELINQLSNSDLLSMDPFEINMIIEQGKLPSEFMIIASTEANSEERIKMIEQLKNNISDNEIDDNLRKPNGYWTLETCKQEANNYNTKKDWKIGSQSSYNAANLKGWLDECCAHMIILKIKHTKENCKKDALKYNTKIDWKIKSGMYYGAATRNGWIEECCSHMEKLYNTWTLEDCKSDALKYNTRWDWGKNSGAKYKKACDSGWIEECCAHMEKVHNTWTLELCKEEALKYKTKIEWKIKGTNSYATATRNGWVEECCSHMEILVFSKDVKLNLINNLAHLDLISMDPFEIYTIIGQGKVPVDFGTLANTEAGSDERITTLEELKERFSSEDEQDTQNETNVVETQDNEDLEIVPVDDVDAEITDDVQSEPTLPSINTVADLHSLDNSLYATMDKEAFESLIQYKLRKLWNNVLNQNVTIESIKNETGGEYFTMIKNLFLEEFAEVNNYQPRAGYSFKYEPNLMQKLTVIRLLKNKSYGNWSGTGAGKTLSFIVASREIESKLTLIIALNSTIKQTCGVIKEVYPDSKIYTQYKEGFVFDRTKNNYLVLNYEKFQQGNSELLFQDLTNNNQIDFVVIDEVHNAKQRSDDEESQRREVLTRLLGRVREKNNDLYTLVMSATPVVNNLFEAKSLLMLLTGLEYHDIDTRRTLKNALKIFQQLILNGLRYIPKYDIEMNELTGSNMSNLNIDGSHLLDTILELPQSNYIAVEKLLLNDKLKAINSYLRKGVIVYSYFTTGFINEIESYITQLGYSVGTYTGEESPFIREENLNKFISGEIDILIGSRPIGTGVDGLQGVCDRMIPITLPWTDSEYTQLKGRIYRQGSIFGSVEIIIPQVRIELGEGDFWSWDVQRLNVIKNKKTLADAAVDGIVPSRVLPTRDTMFRKSQESLQKWKDRINDGNIIDLKRRSIELNLYPDIDNEEQRQKRIQSELSEFNRRGKTTKSSTMHNEFTDNPDSWFRYHALRKERMNQWDEIPYEFIATKIRNKNHNVVDFGCGENLFKNCIPNNKVISFDHVAFDDSVIACDMKDVSQWVENETMDVCVFSLALWGTNYKDYIKEAYRVLNYGGMIHISEPAKYYETPESEQDLINLISEVGFKVVGGIERRSKFIYITGIKM